MLLLRVCVGVFAVCLSVCIFHASDVPPSPTKTTQFLVTVCTTTYATTTSSSGSAGPSRCNMCASNYHNYVHNITYADNNNSVLSTTRQPNAPAKGVTSVGVLLQQEHNDANNRDGRRKELLCVWGGRYCYFPALAVRRVCSFSDDGKDGRRGLVESFVCCAKKFAQHPADIRRALDR